MTDDIVGFLQDVGLMEQPIDERELTELIELLRRTADNLQYRLDELRYYGHAAPTP